MGRRLRVGRSDALLEVQSQRRQDAGPTSSPGLADVRSWVTSWRAFAKKEGVEYRIRLLVPHADSQLAANEFFIEGGSPTLASYAKAWEWWYTDSDAATSNQQLTAATTCDTRAVHRSTD